MRLSRGARNRAGDAPSSFLVNPTRSTRVDRVFLLILPKHLRVAVFTLRSSSHGNRTDRHCVISNVERKPTVGIIGIGMVGASLARYFTEKRGWKRGSAVFLYDIDKKKGCRDDVGKADILFICVPTPRAPDGSADLTAVASAFREIPDNKVVVIKSTVPPGATDYFQKRYPNHRVLFNPEFLTEANAWKHTVQPDRQLVGWTGFSKRDAPVVLSLLPRAPIRAPSKKLNLTATEAEIVKYAANIFLARKVTFANAVYDLARRHGADYEKVKAGVGADPRIGHSHLDVHRGGYRGYGGYCFVKDTDGLIAHCRAVGLGKAADLFEADRAFNTHLLASQGLTPKDVSVHDREWIRKRIRR